MLTHGHAHVLMHGLAHTGVRTPVHSPSHRDRHAKETHIVSSSAADDETEEQEVEKLAQPHMMIKIDRKSSEVTPNASVVMANPNSPVMSLLDIMRESSALLRLNFSAFMWVTFILIFPFSALLLSASSLRRIPYIANLYIAANLQIHSLASALGILHSSLFNTLYIPLSRFIFSFSLCSPLFFTTWLLAKAFTIFAVSSNYSSRKLSLKMFSSIALKLWRRLFCTYICIVCAFVAFFTIAILAFGILIATLTAIKLPAGITLLAEMAMGLLGSVLFAHMIIVATLATVVCILEDHTGMACVMRCVHLLRGRTQVALSLVLTSGICTAMVESLYEHRVIGVAGGRYEINAASRLWEAPLLIFIYSFIYLYYAIMSGVFYFTCKSAAFKDQHVSAAINVIGDHSKHAISSAAAPTDFSNQEP